jgi:hypothetical protein
MLLPTANLLKHQFARYCMPLSFLTLLAQLSAAHLRLEAERRDYVIGS